MQKIHIDVIEPPDWADISISQPDIYVEIPTQGTTTQETTSLVISPFEEAPAIQQTIELKFECETFGRINNASTNKSISFTPAYVPTLTLMPSKPSVITTPNNITTFPIKTSSLSKFIAFNISV